MNKPLLAVAVLIIFAGNIMFLKIKTTEYEKAEVEKDLQRQEERLFLLNEIIDLEDELLDFNSVHENLLNDYADVKYDAAENEQLIENIGVASICSTTSGQDNYYVCKVGWLLDQENSFAEDEIDCYYYACDMRENEEDSETGDVFA